MKQILRNKNLYEIEAWNKFVICFTVRVSMTKINDEMNILENYVKRVKVLLVHVMKT
jgi:hypothetical protein